MFDIYMNGMLSYEDDLNILKRFEAYGSDKKEIVFTYDIDNPIYNIIKEYFPSDYYVETMSDFQLQTELMSWTHYTLGKAKDVKISPSAKNFFDIYNRVNGLSEGVNCLSFATILNEIFLAFGYKSRMVQCHPIDLRSTECHCMTVVYSDEYKRWIAFDPAFNTYYMDENKNPLGIRELRHKLCNKLPVYTYLTPRVRQRHLLMYLTKNMIRFQCLADSKFDMMNDNADKKLYQLNPSGILLNDKRIKLEKCDFTIINTTDEETFWCSP